MWIQCPTEEKYAFGQFEENSVAIEVLSVFFLFGFDICAQFIERIQCEDKRVSTCFCI